MISLKKYLDSTSATPHAPAVEESLCPTDLPWEEDKGEILTLALAAYRSSLREMGNYSVEACPALGTGLKQSLATAAEKLTTEASAETVASVQTGIGEKLQNWGRQTAEHYRRKTAEVKDLLIVMAHTAQSVGERDQRCAGQICEVTTRLQTIASLEDLTEIRSSIEQSAADLKTSVDRMTAEGKQAIAQLKAEVCCYQTKLEEAEELASRDALTGLRNRAWVEGQLERRFARGTALSAAIVDIDDFKRVNDKYGHLVGDELLQKFSLELRTASRATDMIGRWGGDEFILVLNCGLAEAGPQIERLRSWVCQDYAVHTRTGTMKLKVEASIGLAERTPADAIKDLLARADAAMYKHKARNRLPAIGSRR